MENLKNIKLLKKVNKIKNQIPRFDSNLNASTDSFILIDPISNKSKSRVIPLHEHEIKHVVFNIPNINSNRDGCRYLNVPFPRWKKYALLYINKETNKSYFQILLDRMNEQSEKGNYFDRQLSSLMGRDVIAPQVTFSTYKSELFYLFKIF
jgi:hypothetical protein